MKLYRYELRFSDTGFGQIYLREFVVIRKAGHKSLVIKEKYRKERRMMKNAIHPFAHETEQAALRDLERRTELRRGFAIGVIDLCDWGLKEIAKMEEEENG